MPPTKLSNKTLAIPKELVEKINLVEKVAVSNLTQSKDASRMREFLRFCEGLRIHNDNALTAVEDLLAAWASSYAG